MRPIRLLLVIYLFVGFFLVLSSVGLFAGELEKIREKGEIVVSLNSGYPPFSMMIDGQRTGLDVDLANIMAGYLGVKVKFIRPENYSQQIPRLLSGESDIIIAAMTRTVERGLQVSFTDPYFKISQAALVRREILPPGADSYFDLLSVEDLSLGVKAGTTHEKFARELFDEKAIKTYPTAQAAVEAVLKGEVDAMVADSPFVRVWRDSNPDHYLRIAALLAPVTLEYYAFAVRQGDPVFLNWLNLFIDQIKIDGTLGLLQYEYFEEMAWTGKKTAVVKMNAAEFLKNKFIANKKAMIEKRRKELPKMKPAYE